MTQIEAGQLHLASGQVHTFDICILAASFTAPDLAAVSGLPVDPSGRMKVDEHLRCLDEPRVIGAGDAVVAPAVEAAHLRMGCVTALPLGAQAAEGPDRKPPARMTSSTETGALGLPGQR